MPCLREQDTSVSRTPRAELLVVTQTRETLVAEQQRPTRAYLAVLELHRLIAFGAGALMQGKRAHGLLSIGLITFCVGASGTCIGWDCPPNSLMSCIIICGFSPGIWPGGGVGCWGLSPPGWCICMSLDMMSIGLGALPDGMFGAAGGGDLNSVASKA